MKIETHNDFEKENGDVKKKNSYCTIDGSWMRWDDTQVITHVTWKHKTIVVVDCIALNY